MQHITQRSQVLIPIISLILATAACRDGIGEPTTTPAPAATAGSAAVVPATTTAPGTTSPTPVAEPMNIGEVAVSEAGCTLRAVDGPIPAGRVSISAANQTDAPAGFHMWRIADGATYEQLTSHIEEERRRTEAGEDFIGPRFTDMGSLIPIELQAGQSGTMVGTVRPGTYGIVCARTFPTRFGVFALVGPLEVGDPMASISSIIASILLPQSEPPTGTEFFKEEGDSALTQPVQDSSHEIKQAVGEEALATLYRIFFTPEMLDTLYAGPAAMDEYSSNFSSSGHWSVGSWVTVYGSPEAASSALALIFEEFTTSWQLLKLDDPGLGDEGAVFVGNPPQAGGVPTTIYFWQTGPYLLQVGAHGSVEVDADEIRAIAGGMESRVPRS